MAMYGNDFGSPGGSLKRMDVAHAPTHPPEYSISMMMSTGVVYGASTDGHWPDIFYYNYKGQVYAYDLGKARYLPVGGIIYRTTKSRELWVDGPAHSILIKAGGWNAVCLSQVSVRFHTGHLFHLMGDIPAGCNYDWRGDPIETVGTKGERSRCFWLDKDHSDGIKTEGISYRPGDMEPKPDRLRVWAKHPEYLCNGSPRLHRWTKGLFDKGIAPWERLTESEFRFKHYREPNFDTGGLDENPQWVLNWNDEVEWGQEGNQFKRHTPLPKQSDPKRRRAVESGNDTQQLPPPPPSSPSSSSSSSPPSFSPEPPPSDLVNYPNTGAGQVKYMEDHNMTVTDQDRYYLTLFDEPRVRRDWPRLVVSDLDEHGAVHKCTMGQWEGVDYFTPSADTYGLYCDMRTGVVFPGCSEQRDVRCFDADQFLLRASEPVSVPHVLSKKVGRRSEGVDDLALLSNSIVAATINDGALWNWQYSSVTIM